MTDEKVDTAATPSTNEEDDMNVTEGEDMVPQQSRVESIWPAENISFPREAVMVFVACMAQFCTRKLAFFPLFPFEPTLHDITVHSTWPSNSRVLSGCQATN